MSNELKTFEYFENLKDVITLTAKDKENDIMNKKIISPNEMIYHINQQIEVINKLRLKQIKSEVIKWVKKYKKIYIDMLSDKAKEDRFVLGKAEGLREFFNITEDELK